jgi:thioesterase domain-containing protein
MRLSIEAMAADHLTTLRSLQPRGPYRLGGYCNGGLIAFEMARRLQAIGERVDCLALVDSAVHNTGTSARFLRALVDALGVVGGLPPRERLRWFVGSQRRIRGLGQRARRYLRRPLSGAKPAEHIAASLSSAIAGKVHTPSESLDIVYYRAVAGYVPRRYAGAITVFRSHDAALGEQPDLGWRAVAREVDVHAIAGDHFTSITRHVCSLGESLRDVLTSGDLAT